MSTPGPNNSITDIASIRVGHYTDTENVSGVTVIFCPEGAVGGVDVRGSAPGTRETDLLDPTNLVAQVQAVVLTGGSVYGLATAQGVVTYLAEQGHGFPLEGGQVAPIVPGAALFDLGRGPQFVPPITPDWGYQAAKCAGSGPLDSGCVGAGTGANAGGIKGGMGSASLELDRGLTVGALVAVNSLGSVINPATGRPWEIGMELEDEFGDLGKRTVDLPAPPEAAPGQNTTIGVVATDARLTKTQAKKIAQMAHDGMARAIRPAHTMFDGDTIFTLATGRKTLPATPGFFAAPGAEAINELGHAAADCMTRAIIHAVLKAESMAGMIAFRDLNPR
jgi:L-aminopeptidase/D-esterase-like protein